jgi:dTDP-4-dehydrorhamnose 3,5-epimerase
MRRLESLLTPIAGLHRVDSHQLGDPRGYFVRAFCAEELSAAGWPMPVAQINLTYTRRRGTIRGLHFQYPPHAEAKLVRCLRGEIWDVVVDLRRNSPTFLKWHAEVLSQGNMSAFLIPQGCAHAFQSLTDDVEMLYLHSAVHVPASEGGLNVSDPMLAIEWPLSQGEMSARDRSFPFLSQDFKGIAL